MLRVPDNLLNKKSYKIKKKRFHVVEYTSVTESTFNEVVLTESAIVYIVRGTKVISLNNERRNVGANQLFMVPPGRYIMSEYLAENEPFESIMVFFNSHNVEEIIGTISKSIKIEQKYDSSICVADCSAKLMSYFELLIQIYRDSDQSRFSKELINVKITELIYLLLSDPATQNQVVDLLYRTVKNQKVSISKVVKDNLYSDVTVGELAQLCSMSLSTFKREFKKLYNDTPINWIMDRRLDRALYLVKSTTSSIGEIAFECGFESYIQFSRRFKSKYGKSANEVRTLL